MRKCTKCGKRKDEKEFYKSKRQKDGLYQWCKQCHHDWYVAKRDEKREIIMQTSTLGRFEDFGAQVCTGRGKKNFTQEQLGSMIGVTGTQIRLWEKGLSIPRQSNLKELCQILQFEAPLSILKNKDGHFPIRVAKCVECGNDFPVYKEGVEHCGRDCSGKAQSRRQTGEGNPMWKGGRHKAGSGYIAIKVGKKWVLEHRHVMSQILGRPLKPGERVHHKHGVRDDNRREMLELWTTKHKNPPGVRVSDLPPHCPTCTCHIKK